MRILTIEQHDEMYESWCLNKTCPVLTQYTLADWTAAYLQLIAPAGVDTFCESNIEDEVDLLVESAGINEGIFRDLKNVLKGRKLVKMKYKGFDQAAKNYVSQSSKIGDSGNDQKVKDQKRIALKKSYEGAVKAIEAKVKKPLDDLKKESPVVAKYEKYAKLKYQLSLLKLHNKFGVSMANIKAYNSDKRAIKDDISQIAGDISSAEKEVKAKTDDEGKPKKEDTPKEDKPKKEDTPKEDKPAKTEDDGKKFSAENEKTVAKLESDIAGFNKTAKEAKKRKETLKGELETAKSDKKSATDPDAADEKIANITQEISSADEDIKAVEKQEKEAKDKLAKIPLESNKNYKLKSLNEFMNAS